MGTSYNPPIVTDGLVCCLDAANVRSYPKTGTTWTDLVGGNDGAMQNMTASNFSSDNAGILNLDGTNERISLPVDGLHLYDLSICCWVNVSNTTANGTWPTITIKENNYLDRNWFLGMHISSRNFIYVRSISGTDVVLDSNISPTADRWYFICATNNTTPTYSIYIDGELKATNTYSGSLSVAGTVNHIGVYNTGSLYPFQGKIANMMYYNRVLTGDEVRQNYEATVGRFT